MNFRIIKKQSKNTYLNKDKKEVHYYNYFLITDNGTRIQIKCAFPVKDNKRLDMVCDYER